MTKLNPRLPEYCLLFILSILIVFSGTLGEMLLRDGASSVDELLFLICLFILLIPVLVKKKVNRDVLFVFCVGCLLVILSFIYGRHRPVIIVVAQTILCFKFFFFFYAFDSIKSKGFQSSLLSLLLFCSVLGVLVELLVPGVVTSSSKERFIGGITRVGGLQASPNSLAILLGLVFLASYYRVIYLPLFSGSMRRFWLFVIFFLILLTGSRTALLVVFSSLFVKMYFNVNSKKIRLLFLSIAIIICILGALTLANSYLFESIKTNLTAISDDSGYIRGMMIFNGVRLAIENFPFGSGAATFGTPLSTGSIVYEYLGLNRTAFVIEGRGIYDSNFASVVGEFGLIGLIIFTYLISMVLVKNYKRHRNFGFSLSMVIFFILSFFTTPLLMNSYLSLIVTLVLTGVSDNKTKTKTKTKT
jgi:hypothetical protein